MNESHRLNLTMLLFAVIAVCSTSCSTCIRTARRDGTEGMQEVTGAGRQWCDATMRQLLPEGFACDVLPGRFQLGSFSSPQSSQTEVSACLGLAQSVRTTASQPFNFSDSYEVTRNLGGGVALNLSEVVPGAQAGAGLTASQNAQARFLVRIGNARFVNVPNLSLLVQTLLNPTGQNPTATATVCRDLACGENVEVTDQVLVADVQIEVALTAGTNVGANLQLSTTSPTSPETPTPAIGDGGVSAPPGPGASFQITNSNAQSGRFSISSLPDKPITVGYRRIPMRGVMGTLCPPPRAAQIAREREILSQVWQGLLDSYQCQWAATGTDIANRICNGPCDPVQLRDIYQRPIGQLTSEQRGTICEGLMESLRSFTEDPAFPALTCTTEHRAWINRNSGTSLQQLLAPTMFSTPQSNVLAQQIALLREIRDQLPEPGRAQLIRSILQGWTRHGRTDLLNRARSDWSGLVSECGAFGCELHLNGASLSTQSTWEDLLGASFDVWLDTFSQPENARFAPGCSSVVVLWFPSSGNSPGAWRNSASCPPNSRPTPLSPDRCTRADLPCCLSFRPSGDNSSVSQDLAARVVTS